MLGPSVAGFLKVLDELSICQLKSWKRFVAGAASEVRRTTFDGRPQIGEMTLFLGVFNLLGLVNDKLVLLML